MIVEIDTKGNVSDENIDIKNKNSKYCRQDAFLKNMNRIKRLDSKRNTKKNYRYQYKQKKKESWWMLL